MRRKYQKIEILSKLYLIKCETLKFLHTLYVLQQLLIKKGHK